MKAYARQMCLPEIGLEGQQKLMGSSVLIIGIGGLGCAALPYLAASGIRRIGMIDFDCVEESNLARQTLFGSADVGCWKVEVAKKRLSLQYPETHFQAEFCRINSSNAQDLFLDYELILDCSDNIETRLAINDACFFLKKPWIYGSIHQWEGQISLFLPGNPDYRSLFPQGISESSCLDCSAGGVLGPFVGLIGTIQALTAIKWLAGVENDLAGKLLMINGKNWRSTLLNITPQTQNYGISYSVLQEWMVKEHIQLMDVREPHEKHNGDLGGLVYDFKTLNNNKKIVLYCQTGQRSSVIMHRLRRKGYEAYSLDGGINTLKNLQN